MEQNIKSIINLFSSPTDWSSTTSSVDLTTQYHGHDLYCCFEMSEQEFSQLDPQYIKQLLTKLDDLDLQSKTILKQIDSEEGGAKASELILTDLTINKDHTCALGYHAGPSPAGELYFYINIDQHFQCDPDIIYEVY